MEIKNGFTDKNGNSYPLIKEVAFTRDNYFGNLGKYVCETVKEDDFFFGVDAMEFDTRGVYIYQSNYDKTKALRVYKCFLDFEFNGDRDEVLISKLLELQEKINLTNFPDGVVTLDGFVIGQEIPYYEGYDTFNNAIDNLGPKEVLTIYRKCLLIIKELHDKGINYLDVHAKNFLINKDLDVQLIDFETDLVKFCDDSTTNLVLERFYNMVNILSEKVGDIGEFQLPRSFREAFTNLESLEKIFTKKYS